MKHKLTLLDVVDLTPDTRHYVFTRPEGYSYTPGQATELALDRDGWRDEARPFTFTGARDAQVLTFVIKSYPDHDGVTARIAGLSPGDTVLIGDAWGAIADKGPGVFIAGGAGITPFVGILSDRARSGTLDGCHLIFANESERDIILRPFWEKSGGLSYTFLTAEKAPGLPQGRIDADFLDKKISDWDTRFYLCGPPPMEDAVLKILRSRNVPEDSIVRESE